MFDVKALVFESPVSLALLPLYNTLVFQWKAASLTLQYTTTTTTTTTLVFHTGRAPNLQMFVCEREVDIVCV